MVHAFGDLRAKYDADIVSWYRNMHASRSTLQLGNMPIGALLSSSQLLLEPPQPNSPSFQFETLLTVRR